MLDQDKEKLSPAFQPDPRYLDPERSPFVVTGQTYRLLQLYRAQALSNFSFGVDYIKGYTFKYLQTAEQHCDTIFDEEGVYLGNADPESREAAQHAYVIFGSMRDMTVARNLSALSTGFSRRGVLRAPDTKPLYLARIREMKTELAHIAVGNIPPSQPPESRSPLFRTFVFFRVADIMTPAHKLNSGEKELREQQDEQMHYLLKGVDISLD